MPDNQRIEELRRRVHKDPASIAFAQLAEEHRRAGQFEEAVRVSRAGLDQHPAYLSARITLGRALLEMGRYDESAAEFEYVLKAAPDNLTAVRELADVQRKRANTEAQRQPQGSTQGSNQGSAPGQPQASAQGRAEGLARSQVESLDQGAPAVAREPAPTVDPIIAELESWLAVLAEERADRTARI